MTTEKQGANTCGRGTVQINCDNSEYTFCGLRKIVDRCNQKQEKRIVIVTVLVFFSKIIINIILKFKINVFCVFNDLLIMRNSKNNNSH